jgi:zinc protease
MKSDGRGVAAAVGLALIVAACSGTDRGVASQSADRIETPSTEADAPTTTESNVDDPSDTGRASPPDPTGLPSLGELDPGTRAGKLDNGLRYLVRSNDNPGAKVEMRLVVDAGSGLESEDQVGGAHFLEHMLFNGTEAFPKNELIDVLRGFGASFGADINARTSYDETVYQLTTPNDPDVVATGLDILQQWLSFAAIDPDEVVAERGIVLDEWRVDDQTAQGRVFVEISDFFLAGSPYEGHDPIGSREAIETTESEQLRRFYDDWYRPGNAAVIVVGDIAVDDIEAGIVERFSSATSRGSAPERVDLEVEPATEARARVVSDPDLAEASAFVTLPTSAREFAGPEEMFQWEILEILAFDVIATRLDGDARRGEAPFDDASVDSSGFVRDLAAPEIAVSTDGDRIEASVVAILDEYERVRRYGITAEELDRAVATVRSSAQVTFDGRDTRQDADYAEEYVDHVLLGDPYVTADREFEFLSEVLDRASPETVAHVFLDRLDVAGPHVFVSVPADEAADTPNEDRLVELAAEVREVDPRGSAIVVPDGLMERPEPADEVGREQLSQNTFTPVLDPTVIEYPNGVRVALNTTDIVEGRVFFEGRSPGGLDAVADEDVPDADAVATVVAESGLGEFDRLTLDAFLDGREAVISPFIEPFEENLFGESATSDLEVLFQLIHLTMTASQVDPIALDQYLDDELALAEDPSIDAGYAEFVALRDARYDDIRYRAPTVATLETVDAVGIERVMADRYGDAGDWAFSFSGDFDLAEAEALSASYLGTLPSSGRVETVDYVDPPPPPDIVRSEVAGGEGEQARVSFLFTAAASADRRDDIVAQIVTLVISNRLADFIREELGDSYAPFGVVQVGSGATPPVESYITVSTGPEQLDAVAAAVVGQLDDLRANGPTSQEFDAAVTTVEERLNFVNNVQINDEALNVIVDPAGNVSFDDYVFELQLVRDVSRDDVTAAIVDWVDLEEFIEVGVLPR